MTAITVERNRFIGGSDAAAVLGISPWKTPIQLWEEKTKPSMPESHDPSRARVLERGKLMEPYVCDVLARETGLVIEHRNRRFVDTEFPFIACEVDAEAQSGENIEIKTVSPFKAKEWGEIETDEIPVYYTAQAQHGLMVTGRSVCVFGVLIGGDDFRIYRVERDDEIIHALRAREVEFWKKHVETLTPPLPANADDVARLFPTDTGAVVEADADALAAYGELRALEAEAGELARRIDGCKEAIKRHMGPASVLTLGTKTLATWKTQRTKRFDQRAFQIEQPELFERFIKASEQRTFRLR